MLFLCLKKQLEFRSSLLCDLLSFDLVTILSCLDGQASTFLCQCCETTKRLVQDVGLYYLESPLGKDVNLSDSLLA